jgi:hypothetical protein
MISKTTETRSGKCLRTAQRPVNHAAERQAHISAGHEDSRDEIDRVLRDNLDRAKVVFESARTEFKSMMHDIPSGPPHADATARMQTGNSYRAAMADYRRAAREFSDFLLHDIVPYRLKECREQTGMQRVH